MKSKRLALLSIKYLPLVMSALMVNHVIWALLGTRLPIAETTGSLTPMPAIVILLVSHAFGFCWLHKQFTIYVLASSLMMDYCRYVGTEYVTELRVIFLAWGVILFTLLAIKHKAFYKCKCDYGSEQDDEESVERVIA